MPRSVTSTEAQSRFGELIKWTTQHDDAVIVKLYGEAAVVIMSYAQHEQVEQLRRREQKRETLKALDALRQAAQQQNPDLSSEQAYRLAGFSDELVQETIQTDQGLIAQ